MRHVCIAFLVLLLCFSAAAKKRKESKPPDIQVVETTARRTQGIIALDGRIRNTSDKPLEGLTLVFDFMAPGRSVITTQKTQIEEQVLEPGAESIIRVQLADPVRAVRYRLAAVDEDGRDLRLDNPGPFVIE